MIEELPPRKTREKMTIVLLLLALLPLSSAYNPKFYLLRHDRRAATITLSQTPPPGGPPPAVRSLEVFVGSLLQAAEGATKVASQAADQWVNSGWQLQKRAGQPLPEIRPNAASVAGKANAWLPAEDGEAAVAGGSVASPPPAPLSLARKAPELGLAGPTGSLAQVDQQASALLAPTQGSLELQKEFCSFLAPQEGRAYRTNEAGEVIFASRDALAALVVEFSYAKLRELAAAARALARYVDDLEGHLVYAYKCSPRRARLPTGTWTISKGSSRRRTMRWSLCAGR